MDVILQLHIKLLAQTQASLVRIIIILLQYVLKWLNRAFVKEPMFAIEFLSSFIHVLHRMRFLQT